MTIQTRRRALVILALGLAFGLQACGSPSPKPATTEQVEAQPTPLPPPAPAVVEATGMPDVGPATISTSMPTSMPTSTPTSPRSTGVTSDPGTRYLSTGFTGGLTVETLPPAPPELAARD